MGTFYAAGASGWATSPAGKHGAGLDPTPAGRGDGEGKICKGQDGTRRERWEERA